MKPNVLAVLFITLIAQVGHAQLFPRAPWNRQRTQTIQQTSCPGGVCPTVTTTSFSNGGHWSYPGTIAGHLQQTHGQSVAGLTRGQMLNLHDALHEGRAVRTTTVKHAAPPVIIQQSPIVWPQSTIIVPAPIPTAAPRLPAPASASTFGLTSAAPIPDFVLAQVDEPAEVRSEFRQALIEAITAARKSGKITFRESVKLRVATISPAFIERAEALAITQVAFSGEASEHIPIAEDGRIQTDGINWQGLATFVEAFIPLLLTLLKAFGL